MLLLRSQMVEMTAATEIEMCSLRADVGSVDQNIPGYGSLNAKAPRLHIRRGIQPSIWSQGLESDIGQQPQRAPRRKPHTVGERITEPTPRRSSVALIR